MVAVLPFSSVTRLAVFASGAPTEEAHAAQIVHHCLTFAGCRQRNPNPAEQIVVGDCVGTNDVTPLKQSSHASPAPEAVNISYAVPEVVVPSEIVEGNFQCESIAAFFGALKNQTSGEPMPHILIEDPNCQNGGLAETTARLPNLRYVINCWNHYLGVYVLRLSNQWTAVIFDTVDSQTAIYSFLEELKGLNIETYLMVPARFIKKSSSLNDIDGNAGYEYCIKSVASQGNLATEDCVWMQPIVQSKDDRFGCAGRTSDALRWMSENKNKLLMEQLQKSEAIAVPCGYEKLKAKFCPFPKDFCEIVGSRSNSYGHGYRKAKWVYVSDFELTGDFLNCPRSISESGDTVRFDAHEDIQKPMRKHSNDSE